jgi:hypothetical protein
MSKMFRTYTHAMPLDERTCVLFNEDGFANTVEEKLSLARTAQRATGAIARRRTALRAAWPGSLDTHVFAVTPEQVIERLSPKPAFKVGDIVKLATKWGGAYAMSPAAGTIGVIRRHNPGCGDLEYGVEWAGFTTGNDLDGDLRGTKRNAGWSVGAKHIVAA